jgi:hypothetical protein
VSSSSGEEEEEDIKRKHKKKAKKDFDKYLNSLCCTASKTSRSCNKKDGVDAKSAPRAKHITSRTKLT